MQILTGHALPLSLALAARPGAGWCVQGAIHLMHADAPGAHWCSTLAQEPVADISDAEPPDTHDAFRASAPGWTCVALVFTGDELVLLQDGVVVGRRVFRAATLAAPGPGAVPGFALGADLDGRHGFHGAIAGLRLWNGIPAVYRAAMLRAEHQGMGVLASKHADLDEVGAASTLLGEPVEAERSLRLAGIAGRICQHEHGALMWSRATGAHVVHGIIHDLYQGPRHRNRLGWPLAPERTQSDVPGASGAPGVPTGRSRSSTRIQRFQRGVIVWSAGTGAHPIHGPLFARYLALGAELGPLGLPIQRSQHAEPVTYQEFQHGRLVHTPATGTHALHGPTLKRYLALSSRTALLGHPVSDTMPIHAPDRALLGHVSYFERGAIYWSPPNGAWEVCGRVALHYQCCGGPAGALGFPLTAVHDPDAEPAPEASAPEALAPEALAPEALAPEALALEALAPGALAPGVPADASHGETSYARFEHGIIAHRRDRGTCALQSVRLRLERVRRLRDTSVAAFSTRVWLRVNQEWVHRGTRLPIQGYAVSSAALALTHFFPVRPDTEVWFRVEVCDHEDDDRVLGAVEQRFDMRDLWGIWGGDDGSYEVPIAAAGDLDAFVLAFRAAPAAEPAPARLPADPADRGIAGCTAFRRLGWWRFGNFRARALSRELFAESFRPPLPADSACWPEPPAALSSLWEPSFHDMAYAGVAANGNCFGLATTAVHALAGSTVLTQPVARYHLTPEVRTEIVRRQAQQLGAEVIAWMISLLASPEALSPRAVFDQIERALRLHLPVPLCIYDVPGDRGDCLLAYASRRMGAGDDYGHIYVADPNAPRSLGRHDPVLVRVLSDDTFQLAHQPERFRNQRAGDDLFPDVLLLPVPFHVFAQPPGVPHADLGLALDDLLGGLILLFGDAEMDQIAAPTQELHERQELQRKVGGRRHLVARVLPGLIRVPRLQAAPSSQLYAQRGPFPAALDLHIKGTKARGGRFDLCVGTYHGEVSVDAPIDRGAVDTVGLRAARVSVPELHLATTMASKLVRVAYRLHRDPRGRPPRGLAFDLPLAPDDLAIVRMDSQGGSVSIRPAGPVRPMDVMLEAVAHGRVQQVLLRGLLPAAAGEAMRLWPRDWAALGSGVVVERLGSLDGAVLQRQVVFGQPL